MSQDSSTTNHRTLRRKIVDAINSVEQVATVQARLFGSELKTSSKRALFAVGFVIVGSATLIFVLIFGAITAALALAAVGLSLWLAFLLMPGALLLVSLVLLGLGVKAFSKIKPPTRALKSWQETKDILAGE